MAANLSRAEAREIVLGQREARLPPADATQIAAMEADIVNGHCGQRPPPEQLTRFVAAQRARDLAMTNALDAASGDGTVLIAGAGHVRRDRAVPRYLGTPDSALKSLMWKRWRARTCRPTTTRKASTCSGSRRPPHAPILVPAPGRHRIQQDRQT